MRILTLLLCLLIPLFGFGQEKPNEFNDTINRDDPNFVTVSLVVLSPGDVLYSCVGHALLRMQCPKFGLDNCYTYEGEDVEQKVLSFLAGNLKMGLFCIPTSNYIKLNGSNGRGIKQYKLNLPPKMKQELWRVLDNEVAQGINQPYDYLERGCAQTILGFLELARRGDGIEFGTWSQRYDMSRREIMKVETEQFPWNRFVLCCLSGSGLDKDCSYEQKVIIPTDLVNVLQHANIDGKKIITDKPQVLSTPKPLEQPSWFSPMVFAFILLVLACISWKVPYIDYGLLALQTVMGLFITYLVCISNLPCNSWNWLIIPFNPLPALLWKWRSKWAIWYVAILAIWDIMMWVYPHQLTDWAYTVIVMALIVMYAKTGNKKLRI